MTPGRTGGISGGGGGGKADPRPGKIKQLNDSPIDFMFLAPLPLPNCWI